MEATETKKIHLSLSSETFDGGDLVLQITQSKGDYRGQYSFALFLDGEDVGTLCTDTHCEDFMEDYIIEDIPEEEQKEKIREIYENSDWLFIIPDLKINADFWGRGYGSLLCEAALSFLSRNENASVTINASPTNVLGRSVFGLESFYTNLGFEVINDQEVNRIMMIPSLNNYSPIINKDILLEVFSSNFTSISSTLPEIEAEFTFSSP